MASSRENLADSLESPTLRPMTRAGLPLSPALLLLKEQELKKRIGAQIDGQLQLTLTNNKAVMIFVNRDFQHRRFAARLHRIFIDAPPNVISDLASYIAIEDHAAATRLNQFIEKRQQQQRALIAKNDDQLDTALRTVGKIYDLAEIFSKLNERYFNGALQCQITWGRRINKGKRRSINLGSYCFEEKLIRIHPGLDQEWVPPFYIEWVVFHEMLHAHHPLKTVEGRHSFHPSNFELEERRFADFATAQRWERLNAAALLRV